MYMGGGRDFILAFYYHLYNICFVFSDKDENNCDSLKTESNNLSQETIKDNKLVTENTKKVDSNDIKAISEETGKRKLEADSEKNVKKLKIDSPIHTMDYVNGEESSACSDFALRNTNIEELVSNVSVADCKAIDKVNDLPLKPNQKVETSKKVSLIFFNLRT